MEHTLSWGTALYNGIALQSTTPTLHLGWGNGTHSTTGAHATISENLTQISRSQLFSIQNTCIHHLGNSISTREIFDETFSISHA